MPDLPFDPPRPLFSPVRGVLRPLRDSIYEVPLRLGARPILAGRGSAPVAVFLPARGVEDGSARLRIHDIARALRPLGWRTLVVPWKLPLDSRRRILAAVRADVLVMQGARHDLNRPGLYPGLPIVYDMDDADFHLAHLAGPVAAAMPQVAGVITGSDYVARWCREQGAQQVQVVWTGTPVSRRLRPPQQGRGDIVAWVQTRPQSYREEAELVRCAMRLVAARRPGVTLRLADRLPDDDPAFADSFRAPGLQVAWQPRTDYARYLAGLDDVAVGLAPLSPDTPFSRGKSFGKVLAYLDRQVPVVASTAGEHPRFFTPDTGRLADTPDAVAEAVLALLADPAARAAQADAAFAAFRARLSIGAAADRVAACLANAMVRPRP